MIILGADTMTCSRLDEFIDDDEHDIIASLDYPYKGHKFKMTKENEVLAKKDFIHVNSDVVCFNNQQALEDIIANSTAGPYYEQGGLNKII